MLEYKFYMWKNGKALFKCRDSNFDKSWSMSCRLLSIDALIKNLLAHNNNHSMKTAFIVALEEYDKYRGGNDA